MWHRYLRLEIESEFSRLGVFDRRDGYRTFQPIMDNEYFRQYRELRKKKDPAFLQKHADYMRKHRAAMNANKRAERAAAKEAAENKVLSMRAAGATNKAIAKAVGKSHNYVWGVLKRRGVL